MMIPIDSYFWICWTQPVMIPRPLMKDQQSVSMVSICFNDLWGRCTANSAWAILSMGQMGPATRNTKMNTSNTIDRGFDSVVFHVNRGKMGRDYMLLPIEVIKRTIKKGRWTTSKDICVWILLPVEIRICHVQTSWISHPLNHMALLKQERKQLGTTCNLGWLCLTIQEPHFVASILWHIDAGMFAEPVAWFTRPSRQLHRSAFSKVRSMDVSPMIHLGNPRGPPRDANHYWNQHAWWVKKIEHEQSPSHDSWDSSDFFGNKTQDTTLTEAGPMLGQRAYIDLYWLASHVKLNDP